MSTPTQITIRPDRDLVDVARFPSSAKRLAGERLAFGTPAPAANGHFFGDDGPGIKDVVDAINPLNHIPFISTLYEEATGSTASAASKLIGGALLGGPIGFLAALGNIIFEQETGHSMGGAIVAGLLGEPSATQLAAAEAPAEQIAEMVEKTPTHTPFVEILPPAPKAVEVSAIVQNTNMKMASAITDVGAHDNDQRQNDRDTLALFGAYEKSAHDSYRKAQFTPYLNDVGTSLVM